MITHSKPWITEDDKISIINQLESRQISNGSKNKVFCSKLKEDLEVDNFYLTSNGSSAIYISLLALDIKQTDEIILPAYVCKNVLDAVLHIGAKPVLCDIGEYWCMTPENVENLINEKTKAIIIVHPLGLYCNIEQFKRYNVKIIEDCCQCFARYIHVYKTLQHSDIAVYSFNAIKCLTTGEGGGISTHNEDIADRISTILQNKSIANPLSDINCALGISQLNRYEVALEKRQEIANIYFENINEKLLVDFTKVKQQSMFYRFLLTSDDIDFLDMQEKLFEKGICIRKGIDSYIKLNSNQEFNNSERSLKRTISIPIYPSLTIQEVEYIYNSVNSYYDEL